MRCPGARLATLASALALALVAAAEAMAVQPEPGSVAAQGAALSSGWADAPIATVVAAGLLASDAESFRPDDPLTRAELMEALTALDKPVRERRGLSRPVTMRELDAQIVSALGLLPAARRFRLAARSAGLEPSGMLGTETVARLLGLRFNHPQGQEQLERMPGEQASRAEGAYSLARLLQLGPDSVAYVDRLSQEFVLPPLGDWQRAVLRRALRFVGLPYVWTGVSEKRQKLWSASAPGGLVSASGGFDCSGFVLRVYKLEPFAGAPALASALQGRTTYTLSGEVAPAARIGMAELQPGDIVFFGSRGRASKPAEIGHMGIYIGSGWMVHSSDNGTTLVPLQGWYTTSFAWARRPLAEAGLGA